MSKDEIKESVDNEVHVLHPPRVELRAALVVRGGREVAVVHGVVQHPLQLDTGGVPMLGRSEGPHQAEDERMFDEMHPWKCSIQYDGF